jgi:ribose transport system permease protein
MSSSSKDLNGTGPAMRPRRARVGGRHLIGPALARHSLLLLGLLLIAVFSLALPSSFPTTLTVQSILSNQATTLFLALALTVVITTGEFDLSVGYGVGLLYVLTVGLIVNQGLSWPVAIVVVLFAGLALGLVNGLLVHVAQIDSFIVTLGTGTICYGLVLLYTGGQQIVGALPQSFVNLSVRHVVGLPLPALIGLLLAVVLWVILEYTATGRYLYALGFNRRAAELSGISTRRVGILAFAASGLIVGIAAVLLAARLQVGNTSTGPDYLIPAFAGALLGKTTVKPGRPNVWGTVIAVFVLAIGITGLELYGGAFYVENLFDGTTLIVAVGTAGFVSRRRRTAAAPQTVSSVQDDPDPSQTQQRAPARAPAAMGSEIHTNPHEE